jgi:hypothetical protein
MIPDETVSGIRGGGMKKGSEGVNSNMIILPTSYDKGQD